MLYEITYITLNGITRKKLVAAKSEKLAEYRLICSYDNKLAVAKILGTIRRI